MIKIGIYGMVYGLYILGITMFFVNYFNLKNSSEIFNVVFFSTISLLVVIVIDKLNQSYGIISERGYNKFMEWTDEEIEQYKLDLSKSI